MKEFNSSNYLEDIRKKVPAYDLMIEIIFNSLLKIKFQDLKIKNVLSIAGQSNEIKTLLKNYSCEKIFLVEPSEVMINNVKKDCEDIKNAKIKYICEKYENYNSSTEYELCICLLVLQFVKEPKRFLEKIYNELEVGGKLILSIFSKEQLEYWKEFALARAANEEQVIKTFFKQSEIMNELSNISVEKVLEEIGFRKIEKVSQVLSTTMWIMEK